MSDDSPYNKREVDLIVQSQNVKYDNIIKILTEQNTTLKGIESNQTITQVDVNRIKDTIADYAEIKATVNSLINYKWWLIGAVAAFTLLGGSVVLLFEARIDTKIYNGINDAVSQHFQKVQVIQNN